MLKLEGRELSTLRTPGGDRFTTFVDNTIRAHAYFNGIANNVIKTNQRTNVPDGGVDTLVDAAIPGDTTGWFSRPSIWQYKAMQSAAITPAMLRKELEGSLAKEYIAKGYGYNFCVCDNFAVAKQEEFKKTLHDEIKKLKADAPQPNVLTADHLADWTSLYPSLVMASTLRPFAHMALHYQAWKRNIQVPTRTYVPVEAWKAIQDELCKFVDFRSTPAQTVFSIQGQAGVGKTRMVFESMGRLPNASLLVLYTSDEGEAVKLARILANDGGLNAILVVDECSIQSQVRLDEILRGFKATSRVVVIDNTGIRPAHEGAEYRIEKMPDAVVKTILEKNFSEVPDDRREAYAALAGGFVRLAADLCANHARIQASGSIITGLEDIHRYYFHNDDRLKDEDRQVLGGLALFTKVGFKDEVEKEWTDFCTLLGLNPIETRKRADKLHDAPGFVGRGGRYFYITPEAMAQLAFRDAWRRWAAADVPAFLRKIPPSLLEAFNSRVAESAPEEVRGLVAEFFREWAAKLTAKDLTSVQNTSRLATLVEMSPGSFLPVLNRILEAASSPATKEISGEATGMGGWGPRRTLVWLAEKLLRLPDAFPGAENVLLHLAIAESEPSLGNNATSIWKQIFQIFLSGTPIPFTDRLKLLKSRIYAKSEAISTLALNALEGQFDSHFSRTSGALIVAGRIPPDEWRPRTRAVQRACLDESAALLAELLAQDDKRLKISAHRIAIRRMRFLLLWGYFPILEKNFTFDVLEDADKIKARSAVEQFLKYDCAEDGKRQVPKDLESSVKRWLASSKPKDFRGMMVTLLGVEPWHYRDYSAGDGKRWTSAVNDLASTFFKDQRLLKEHLDWLCSDAANSAAVLGEALGKLDSAGELLDLILNACLKSGKSLLGRGYLMGLLAQFPQHADSVNVWLDSVQDTSPQLAYELFMAVPESTNGLKRLLRLSDIGKLGSEAFHAFMFGASRRDLTIDQYEEILKRLVPKAAAGDKVAHRIAIQIVGLELKEPKRPEKNASERVFQSASVRDLVWKLLEVETSDLANESYYWARILAAAAQHDPERAINICVLNIVDSNYQTDDDAQQILIDLAKTHPALVIKRLGAGMLSKDGWKYTVTTYPRLTSQIPLDILKEWAKEVGIEGVRGIARHLPQPEAGPDGAPVIHPTTEWVLGEYEADDEIFQAFCVGTHSLQMYSGDIAAQHAAEAAFAKKLLQHPLRRLREWAQYEIERGTKDAAWWKEHDEERRLR